jgi:succinylglutamate desuccinylase
MIPLHEIYDIPEGLLDVKDAQTLHRIMPHPTLMHLEGEKKAPLFVTVLLHGNEDTGLFAVQQLLRKYEGRRLPRSLSVFFGNVYAARERLRRLEGQPDYNRVWPDGGKARSDEAEMIAEVTRIIVQRRPFASVDIHNNTGKNPHYGCINRLTPDFLFLSALFGRTVVYFETPKGVQSMALAEHCPAITIECGKPGVAHGTEHAAEYVDTLLHLEGFSHHHIRKSEVDVYHTAVQVTIPESVSFGFSDAETDLRLFPELENDNFSELPAGTLFAHVRPGSGARFEAYDDDGRERSEEFFTIEGDSIRLKKPMMPSMITLDERVIRQDCFCYLMERIDLPNP